MDIKYCEKGNFLCAKCGQTFGKELQWQYGMKSASARCSLMALNSMALFQLTWSMQLLDFFHDKLRLRFKKGCVWNTIQKETMMSGCSRCTRWFEEVTQAYQLKKQNGIITCMWHLGLIYVFHCFVCLNSSVAIREKIYF